MACRVRAGVYFAVLLTTIATYTAALPAAEYRVTDTLQIDTVPSWFPVRFCLLTHGQDQYVSYYNADHQMIVARRRLGEPQWQKVELPSRVGWDSHNYITMAADSEGNLHLSGNMHCVPLVYFRTQKPGDITTFERLPMTGEEENRCTYPRFLTDSEGNLLFTYRSGGSGNGRRFFNRYHVDTRTWTRFLDTPLFEGEGRRNAYPRGPSKGPDGRYHVVWVWRDTPDCATNHHLSYARSRDLKDWEAADGTPVRLPLTVGQEALCVDPIPSGGGIINGCESLAFDSQERPTIAYHKSDENGHMQIYVARFEDGEWNIRRVTEWEKEIKFSGGGAMPFIGISLGRLARLKPDLFIIHYRHRDYGTGRIVLDEATLRPVEREVTISRQFPRELMKPTIDFEGIGMRIAADLGGSEDADTKYVLRWETLGAHHDRPRQPPLPPASRLELVELKRVGGQ
jgi:hypothetical protein